MGMERIWLLLVALIVGGCGAQAAGPGPSGTVSGTNGPFQAQATPASLPAGGSFVTRQGHVVTASSVRFYAADAEQDGVLARQHEIDNIGKQLRAQALLADEARARSVSRLCTSASESAAWA